MKKSSGKEIERRFGRYMFRQRQRYRHRHHHHRLESGRAGLGDSIHTVIRWDTGMFSGRPTAGTTKTVTFCKIGSA